MRAAAAFVDTLDPADRVALLAVPQPGAYIDFTADHQRVRRAVAGLAGRGHPPQATLNIGLFEAYQIAVYGNVRDGSRRRRPRLRGRHRGRGLPPTGAGGEPPDRQRDRAGAPRRCAANWSPFWRACATIEGPKALVWVSGGFVIDGAGLTLREVERRAAASRTTLYVVLLDEPLVDVAQRALAPTPRQDRRMQEEGLLAAASLTGGRLLRAGNNPGPLFDRIRSELTGYYLLGVESRPPDAERESLAIEVAVRRAGARVRAGRTVRLPPETGGPRRSRAPGAHAALPDRHPRAAGAYRHVRVPHCRQPRHADSGCGGGRRPRRPLPVDAVVSPARSGTPRGGGRRPCRSLRGWPPAPTGRCWKSRCRSRWRRRAPTACGSR